jgi:hypothetical protein
MGIKFISSRANPVVLYGKIHGHDPLSDGQALGVHSEGTDVSLQITDYIHHLIHEGFMFSLSHMEEGIADNGSIDMLFVVGPDHILQWTHECLASKTFRIEIYEGPTVSDLGTALKVVNMNRASPRNLDTVAYTDPTVTDNGLKLFEQVLPGGGNQPSSGGQSRPNLEWLFAKSTMIYMKMINISGAAGDASCIVNMYET